MKKKIIVLFLSLAFVVAGSVFAAEIIPVNGDVPLCEIFTEDGSSCLTPTAALRAAIENGEKGLTGNTNITSCEDAGLYSLLKKGSVGAEVEILQKILADAGHYTGPIDGIFGNGTHAAVKAAQTAVSTKADGIVGPLTRTAMAEMCMSSAVN